jgi:hypothetical protein
VTSSLLAVAAVLGTLAVAAGLRALRLGWRPDPRWLLAGAGVAVVALLLVPPLGDADLESYAAYGRAAATGHNPYSTAPDVLAAAGDPVARAVEPPWQDTPSVYGPVATGVETAIGHAAGRSVRTAVVLNRLAAAVAFLLTGLVLHVAARSPDARRRVAVLWSLNPLLLYTLVGGGHVDALMVLPVSLGLALVGTSVVAAGALLGVGLAVKLPALLAIAGATWAVSQSLRRAAALLGAALLTVAVAYALAPAHSLGQVRHASKFVGPTSPWRAVASSLDNVLTWHAARTIVGALAALAALGVAVVLYRGRLPAVGDGLRGRAGAAVGVLALAWLLTGTYVLPWYDALGWAALCLAAASAADLLLLAHTAVLTIAFIPGRDMSLGPVTTGVRQAWHSGVTPLLLLTVAVVAVVVARRAPRSAAA